jgi:hypothetical protein
MAMRHILLAAALFGCAHAHVIAHARVPMAARPRSVIVGRAPAGASPMPGGSNLYRQFGITEDASYDEIVQAYERLCAKNTSNKKELIKLEVAKDRILEDRLRQRMSGTLDRKAVESTWDRAQRLKKRKPLNEYLPPWLRQFFELPEEKKAFSTGTMFAILCAGSIVVPTFASISMASAFLAANYIVYNKGLPPTKEDDGRPAQAKPLLVTLGICAANAGVGFAIGVTLSSILFPKSIMVRATARALSRAKLDEGRLLPSPRAPLPRTSASQNPSMTTDRAITAPVSPLAGEQRDLCLHGDCVRHCRPLLQATRTIDSSRTHDQGFTLLS